MSQEHKKCNVNKTYHWYIKRSQHIRLDDFDVLIFWKLLTSSIKELERSCMINDDHEDDGDVDDGIK